MHLDDADIDSKLKHAFGIFKGIPRYKVRVLFTGDAACIVRHQVWHPEQAMEETPEGVILTLPAYDFTELKMKVLQFGSRARVLEPEEFRQEVRREILEMARRL